MAALATGALGLIILPPAFARAPDRDVTGPSISIPEPTADQPPAESEHSQFAGAIPDLFSSEVPLAASFAQTSNVGGGDSQTSNPSQASGTNNSPQSSAQKGNQNLTVNPVTGMVSASASDYQPLTGDERLKVYFKMNYWSVGAYFGPFFTALVLDQATNSPAQWGGGFSGYGRRVASRLGSAILQGTFQAPTAAILHEDVRFITSGQHGVKRRAWHAVVYSFLTYNNQGHPTLNIANLGSYYASTAVSTAWLPSHNKLAGYTFSNGTEQIGLSVPVNILQEFWPEISHVFHRHSQN
ncbi:MAG TPA: hypothetical protein VI455_15830 [Terriglobia bacterium]